MLMTGTYSTNSEFSNLIRHKSFCLVLFAILIQLSMLVHIVPSEISRIVFTMTPNCAQAASHHRRQSSAMLKATAIQNQPAMPEHSCNWMPLFGLLITLVLAFYWRS